MEVLACDITQHFKPSEEDERSTAAAEAVFEMLEADPAHDRKELFVTLVTQAMCAMAIYVDELQAEEGRRMLEQIAQGKEPPPNFHHIVHPRSNIFQKWKEFQSVMHGPELDFAARTPIARQLYYAGAAGIYAIIADKWPEIGTPAGGVFLEDLEIELANFATSIER